MVLSCIISLLRCLVVLGRKVFPVQHNRIRYWTVYFTRLKDSSSYWFILVYDPTKWFCYCYVYRRIRRITWLIWFVGGVTRFMNVQQSSGSFGCSQSLTRLVLVIRLPFTTSSGSALFLFITATKADFTRLIRDHYLMSRMDCCYITSKCIVSSLLLVVCHLVCFSNQYFMMPALVDKMCLWQRTHWSGALLW